MRDHARMNAYSEDLRKKIVEHWGVLDSLGLPQQLGALERTSVQ